VSSKYLTAQEIADELGISLDHAKKLITKRRIPAVNIGIGERDFWRVSRADLDKYLDDQRAETAARFADKSA
jgi:excisionase family DNA binding protein